MKEYKKNKPKMLDIEFFVETFQQISNVLECVPG